MTMVALNGLEKFSHLEDKIYRTIELAKTLRQEKDDLERQLATVRNLGGDKRELVAQIERLLAEREAIRVRVQGMLDAVIAADPEIAEAIRG
jgi:RNA-binding protein YhbY